MTPRPLPHAAALTVVALLIGPACQGEEELPEDRRSGHLLIPQSAPRNVDLLFVVDDSGTMAQEQERLRHQFTSLLVQLGSLAGGMPDVHLGVTSTSLGTGPFGITYCETPDDGRLLRNDCAALAPGHVYAVDVEPAGCEITRDATGCIASTCTQAACDVTEPGSTLGINDRGCPRCRNYAGVTLGEVFTCLTGVGTQGCGFEQPLEAMKLALDNHADNAGFLREDALLGVVFLTDEDDCSASSPQLFDPTSSGTLMLGPLTGFRCFEFGITCQPTDNRNVLGPRTDCVPREDPGAMLHPISRYVDFLRQLKDPRLLVVAAIAGPTLGNTVTVGLDEYEQPVLEPACSSPDGTTNADPGIRLGALLEAIGEPADLAWAQQSICSEDYTPALEGIGRGIAGRMGFQCLDTPLAGCADPAVEHGLPGDGQPCNDVCAPSCGVEELVDAVYYNSRVPVPPCLEVCATGACPGNQDRSLAYRAGHPDSRDPDLPVEACWHIGYQPACPQSNFAELRIARQQDPLPRTFAEVRCVLLLPRESRCTDGEDNDEDCLTDAEDPDCH